MSQGSVTKRGFGLGLAGAGLTACVTRDAALVNLADLQPLPPPIPAQVADAGAQLGTGADVSGRVTVPVKINGQGPFDFVVDTGANRTVISTELAAALKLPDTGPAAIHGIVGVEPAATAMIDQLEVDAVRSRRLRAPTLSRARLGAEGLLGVDVLRDRLVTIDFRRKELRISPSKGDVASGFDMRREAAARVVPLLGRTKVVARARYRFGQLIIVTADVRGRGVTAFLDSGSQSTVANGALRRVAMGSEPDPKAMRYIVPLLSATGQTAQGSLAILPLLRLGGMKISGLATVFADLHVFDVWGLQDTPSILIGIDVMSQFNAIQLDFGRRQVVFYPRPKTMRR
ncbi:aspartyl protease family protein [Phenylobacterium sp.]|uniref:aspartyl protease family protein n=1 Tax=Phenylobacterium sp. TaxID=1871053 RepID=UPI002F4162F0